jgi:hypothetical protein
MLSLILDTTCFGLIDMDGVSSAGIFVKVAMAKVQVRGQTIDRYNGSEFSKHNRSEIIQLLLPSLS